MTTRVINIRQLGPLSKKGLERAFADNPDLVYIGRAMPRYGLTTSIFANPFHIGDDGDRDEVIEKYRDFLRQTPGLADKARRELQGKKLVCWCFPQACHGDVIVELLEANQ